MPSNVLDEKPKLFGFLLHPRFSMMAFSSAVEPLRAANRQADRQIYDWRIVSRDGGPVSSSSDIAVLPHGGIDDFEFLPNVVVVAGISAQLLDDKRIFAWLRRLERRGARMGALSTGSYTLAKAGLLDGYRCTIHWENLAGFREDFPEIEATEELFEIDRSRFTCSGGTATLDLMLSLIAADHGRALATKVAEQFIHERIRDPHDRQRMNLRSRLGISHPRLLNVLELMEQNLEEPLARTKLARRTGLSTRQLERLFRKYLGRTPTRYYQELRLERARILLTQTSMTVALLSVRSYSKPS